MALNALTLSVTSGVQGRPFQATINGLTTGRVHVRQNDGSPGFSVVNGQLMSSGLPYKTSTVVLRELEPGVGDGFRDTRIDITATTPTEVRSQALAAVGAGRTLRRFRVDSLRNPDGSYAYTILAQDDLGGTTAVAIGRPTLDFPRIGLIGPSLTAQNTYGATTTPFRVSNTTAGPLIWALAAEHRVDFRTMAKSTGAPYVDGDNQANSGAVQSDYGAQIAALASRMSGVANWVAWYDIGRNDIEVNAATLANLQAWMARDVALLRAAGAKKILLPNLWKKPTSYGGVWASGGAARATTDAFNAWLPTYVAASPDLALIDFVAVATDPASADGNPYAWVWRGGGTHWSAVGAQRAGLQAVLPVLRSLTTGRAYPARPAESLVGPLSGTTGGKTSTTGVVADGWQLTQAAATATVVGSQEVINGETYQVVTVSAATGTGVNGGHVQFQTATASPLPVAAGKKVGFRCKLLISGTNVPYGVIAIMGGATGQGGDATNARASALIPQINIEGSGVIGLPGTDWAATPKMDGTIAQDLWLETSSYVLGATGGSTVSLSIGLLFGPALAAGDTITFKVGQIQTFEVA